MIWPGRKRVIINRLKSSKTTSATLLLIVISLLAGGCSVNGLNLVGGAFETTMPSATITPIPTSTKTMTPSMTSTPTASSTPTPTASSTITPTPTFAYHPAGPVCMPILLYHHIVAGEATNRYSVSKANFAVQMAALKRMGYTTVNIAQLTRAITVGENLPQNPIVITFDDGYEDVYQFAFPILKNQGFAATILLVSTYIGAEEFMTEADILDLLQAGWEAGSHSQSHLDLTKNYPRLDSEIAQSRGDLKHITGEDIRIFAYPYGAVDPVVFRKVVDAGYYVGLGLGNSVIHDLSTLYYLDRIEVRADTDLSSLTQAIACPKD